MTSASNLKKQAALLSSLTHSLDQYEAERKRTPPQPRSSYHIAQPTIAFLCSVQPSLTTLTTLQPAFPAPSPPILPLSDRLQQFGAWLASVAPACGIGERWELQAATGVGGEEGNGVVAKRMLPPSSLLMTIPRRAILWASSFVDKSSAYYSAETAAFATVLSDMRDPMLTAMPSLLLALLLMFEQQRGTASPLHAYLNVLPTHFSLPLFTPPDELQQLSHNPALLSVVNLQYNTLMQYVYLHRILTTARLLPSTSTPNSASKASHPGLPSFSWQHFRWAVSIMYTRQNRVCDSLCLIPGWDMCNHRATIATIRTFYDGADETSTTHTADDAVVEAGEAVYIYYGDRSNRDLFVYSGFIDPHNTHRDYELVWTDDVQRAMAAVDGDGTVAVADWERIRGLMRKKAGVDGALTVKLPLPFMAAEWEEEQQRRRQQRVERRRRRQQAWQRWEQSSGEKRSEEEVRREAAEDETEEQAEASKADKDEHSDEERLSSLLSLLRIAALQSKEEAMDALRLQSGTGGTVGQLSSANELRARQLLLRWLHYEQRLYGEDGRNDVERQLKEMEGAAVVERVEQRRALMLRVQLDGLQLLHGAECRVERWIADVS